MADTDREENTDPVPHWTGQAYRHMPLPPPNPLLTATVDDSPPVPLVADTDREEIAAIIGCNIPDGSDLKAADAVLAYLDRTGWKSPADAADLQDQLDRARGLIRTMHREQLDAAGMTPKERTDG